MSQPIPTSPDSVIDANAVVDCATPLWGETRWHTCWNPDTGVGIYIHAGRFRKDLDLWWVHIAAFLPDGALAVDRFWCRNAAVAGLSSGSLNLAMTPEGWTATFDGVGQLTNTAALARAARGASAPSVRLRWDVTATAAAPVWDMYAGRLGGQDFATDLHIQQGATTSGTLCIDDRVYQLNGVGFKDHSSGARSFSTWHGHCFLLAVLPDAVVHAVTIFRGGASADAMGVTTTACQQVAVTGFDVPRLGGIDGAPHDQLLTVTDASGPVTLRAEVMHALPITISEDNDNFNGVDWDMPGDPMVMVESIVRLTDSQGRVGYGFLERSARRSTLSRL